MNWQHFQTYNDAPTHAFEAMCNQLFELWCRRNYSEQMKYFTVVNGAGGDGGVEAYATLADNTVVGVQSKWFLDSITDNQFNQIKGSVETALCIRANIRKYIICIPRDLSSEKVGKGEKIVKNTEANRWEKLKAKLSLTFPELEIELWTDTTLLSELQYSEATGIYRYWFEKSEISEEEIIYSFEKQKAGWLSQKYTPSLHSRGIINETVAQFVGTFEQRKIILQELTKIENRYHNLIKQTNDYLAIINICSANQEIVSVIKNTILQVDNIVHRINQFKEFLITDNPISLVFNHTDWWIDFSSILNHLEAERHINEKYFHISDVQKAILSLETISVCDIVLSLYKYLNNNMLLILGNPGTGKTHGMADIVRNIIVQEKHTALLIQAKSISKDASWRDIILKVLGLSSAWNEDEIWQGLEALSYRNEVNEAYQQTEKECYITPKVLICIDGLDESRPYEIWIERLRETEAISKKYPRIRFCITSRPHVFDNLANSDKLLCNSIFLPSDGDVAVRDLFEAYIKEFDVKINNCTWLKWSIKTPLALQLFCEAYSGQSVEGLSRSVVTITKLLEKKIQRIDDEFRVACDNDYSSNDFIVRKVIVSLAKGFFEKNEITRNELINMISQIPDLAVITLSHKNKIIEHLESYGVLQSYTVEAQDILSCPTIYYTLGIQTIFDYLLAVLLVKQKEDPLQISLSDTLKNNQGALQMASIILLEDQRTLVSEIPCFQSKLDKRILFNLACFALSNVSPVATKKYIPYVTQIIEKNASCLKEIVNRVVLPVSRINEHPLGTKFFHEYLLGFDGVAKRDLIWSVPSQLDGDWDAIWNSQVQLNLQNDIYRLSEEDKGDGLPLVYAWSLTTVDNLQRANYRKELMRWGHMCPSEFYTMFENVYNTNDPQMKEDLMGIAMGVIFSIKKDDRTIDLLGKWVLKTIFAPEKIVDVYDAAIRYYGRAIAERSYACGFMSIEELTTCRPPYKMGSLISMNKEATQGTRMGGFGPIDYDLSRYVICDPIDRKFFRRIREKDIDSKDISEIDYTEYFTIEEVERVLNDQEAVLVESCREILSSVLLELKEQELYRSNFEVTFSYDEDDAEEKKQGALKIPIELPETNKKSCTTEIEDFLKSHAIQLNMDNINSNQFALAACFAYLISQGWNEKEFYGQPNGGEPGERLGIDLAIRRKYHPATHGTKSRVMTFCEKYVWCALNVIYGYLSDRLPLRDDNDYNFVEDYGMLDDFTNPAQELNQKDPDELMQKHEWFIPELLSPPIASLGNTYDDIIRWINEAPIPDFKKWILIDSGIYSPLENEKKDWLSLYSYNSIIEPNVGAESMMWVSSAIMETRDFHCLLEDLARSQEYIIRELENPEDLHSSTKSDVYITPKEICWMNWKKDCYNVIRNATINNGNIKNYEITKAVEECTVNYTEHGDVHYKLPSRISRDMLNIVDGNGHQYFDNNGNLKAIYFESGERWDDFQTFLFVDRNSLATALEVQEKSVFWIIRLLREPSVKAREKYKDLYLRKDRTWIAWFENGEIKTQLFIDNTEA